MLEPVKRNGSVPPPLPVAAAAVVVEEAFIRIGFMSDGSLKIQGPTHNKVLCYGLLEATKMAIAAQPSVSVGG